MDKILLVEDDLDICEVICNYFETKGTSVNAVNSGGEAFDLIRNGLEGYDLVLLDIMLPETDGFTLCRQLRMRSDIPVIFITARGREEDILSGYDLGCDDYIVKPFEKEELILSLLKLQDNISKALESTKPQEGHRYDELRSLI